MEVYLVLHTMPEGLELDEDLRMEAKKAASVK
jgi:hypothetical protein